MSYGYWCYRLFSQFLHLNPVWLERFRWINMSIVGKVRLHVFLYLIAYMFKDLDYTCLISLFACNSCLFFIYIYPDLMRFHVGLCVSLSGSKDWMSYGSISNPLYIQNICEYIAPLYSTNKFPLQICFSNKHFSSPFPPSKSIFLPGYCVRKLCYHLDLLYQIKVYIDLLFQSS